MTDVPWRSRTEKSRVGYVLISLGLLGLVTAFKFGIDFETRVRGLEFENDRLLNAWADLRDESERSESADDRQGALAGMARLDTTMQLNQDAVRRNRTMFNLTMAGGVLALVLGIGGVILRRKERRIPL